MDSSGFDVLLAIGAVLRLRRSEWFAIEDQHAINNNPAEAGSGIHES